MKKSDWRKDIDLPEFVQSFNVVTKGAAALDLLNKVRKNPTVQKGFNKVKDTAVDLLTPKASKEIDKKVKTEVKPEVDTKIKGFKPTDPGIKGFTPSKEIEKERERLIKQRENEKKEKERGETNNKRGNILTPDKKEIDRLRPKKIDTNPVETPDPNKKKETEDPQREKEKDDNKKKIKKITKIKDNNIDKNKQKNDQKIKDSQKKDDKKTVAVPLPLKIKNKTTRRVPPVGGLSKRLPLPLPIGGKKKSTPKLKPQVKRLAPTRDIDGDGRLEFKRKSGEYQETFNHKISETSTMDTPKTKIKNFITEPTTKVIAGSSAAQRVGSIISGKKKTTPSSNSSSSKKVNRLAATRDMDGDGRMEKKRKSGEYQETILYDIVHDYIIAENFASDTEGANKIMLKLSDELMQEIYERTMTASEKRKDTMLKKKYDDSDMKKNMQAQYGKEEGKKVYFATIRKQAMKKEEVESVEEKIKYDKSGSSMDYFLGADPKKTEYYKKNVKKKIKKEEVEVVDEAKYEKGASDYGKTSIRNKRAFGKGGNARPPEERGAAKMLRHDAHQKRRFVKKNNKYGATNKPPVYGAPSDEFKKNRYVTKEEVGITTHSMVMKDKAKKEAMLRMKERDAVLKKLRKEERDEYGDPVGGPKISKKQKEKNLKKNTPDEQHTTTTSEGYGSDRVGPALKVARVIDRVNPRPKPNSKRTRVSRALKLASIKKDEKIRKREENPYSADKRLKMVATSIRDRVKQKAKAMTTREDYIPEEGYDIARDMGRVRPSKDKKDATTMPPSKEMEKTRKVYKGPSALELVKKKYGKAVMVIKKK